jgi:S-(hydroxymethyl)glutathione dehydrogenase/alcohol dehydrogenase
VKAAVLNQLGDDKLDLRDDVTTTDPKPGEVRIKVRASGICHSDLSGMNGTLPALAPGVMGHEAAGEVVTVGDAVTRLSVGDHVIVSCVAPCGSCPSCLRGQRNLCGVHAVAAFTSPRFTVGGAPGFGFAGLGTFAEEVVVPHEAAVKVATDVPFEVAALIGCGVVTGVGAVINTAKVPPGASVAVIGCGGVGISAIQGARLSGAATIVAVDPVPGKHEIAERFGATHATNPDGLPGLIQSLTGGEGFDYVFEAVGSGRTMRAAYDATRRGGTTVIVGVGRNEDKLEFSALELIIQEKKLLASFYGSADINTDYDRLIALWRAGRLDLEGMVTRRLALEEVNDGLRTLQAGEVVRQVISFG